MARIDNLSNYLEDIATAIRTKKETTEQIPAENFDQEILSIETGIDTSDADATAHDIIESKTAYVNGEKITGSLNNLDMTKLNFKEEQSDRVIFDSQETGKITTNTTQFHIANTTIADGIALTPEKIVKGNTILGVEGTAEGGGSIDIKIFANEDDMWMDEMPKDRDLAMILNTDKENQYLSPSKCSIFNKIRIPKTVYINFMDGHPESETKQYYLDFKSFDNNTGSGITFQMSVMNNSYYKKYVFRVDFRDYGNISGGNRSLLFMSDDWYGPYEFDETNSMNVKASDFISDELGENSYYTINSTLYLKWYYQDTNGVYWPPMINGFYFGGLYQYSTMPTNSIKTFTHNTVIEEQTDDMMWNTNRYINIIDYAPLNLDNWKNKLQIGVDKIQNIIKNDYDNFSYDMVHTVEDLRGKKRITSTRIYVYPTSGWETASGTLLYNSTDTNTPYRIKYTKQDSWDTIYYIDVPLKGTVGDVQTLNTNEITVDTDIIIALDADKYFGVQYRYNMHSGEFRKMAVQYDNDSLYVQYKSDYKAYLYETAYHSLNTNLTLSSEKELYPGVLGYGNTGILMRRWDNI